MKDVLQQLSDVIEHRNEETLDIKPFISESLSMTEEFNPKAHMVTQKRFLATNIPFLTRKRRLTCRARNTFLW